jgi:hypothetical protein
LFWKLDISSFSTIYDRPINSSRQERTMCLKLGMKICQEYAKIGDSGYMERICKNWRFRLYGGILA